MEGSAASKVITILRENSFEDEANRLASLVEDLFSEEDASRKQAVIEIQGLCQVRAYGDLKISSMNGWKWNSLLEKLADIARKKDK